MAALEGTNGYAEVLAIPDNRPEVRQANDDFNVVYAQAEAARDLLRNALADEWFVDEERKRLGKTDFYYPVPAQKRAWVDQAIDPGIKGEPRSREKMKNDYGVGTPICSRTSLASPSSTRAAIGWPPPSRSSRRPGSHWWCPRTSTSRPRCAASKRLPSRQSPHPRTPAS